MCTKCAECNFQAAVPELTGVQYGLKLVCFELISGMAMFLHTFLKLILS